MADSAVWQAIKVAAYLGHSSLKEVIRYLHLTEISAQKGRDALDTLADC